MEATKHALERMKQRCLSAEMLSLLDLYGLDQFQDSNSVITLTGKDFRRTLKRIRKELDLLLKGDPVVKVESDKGTLITAYRQSRKAKYKYM